MLVLGVSSVKDVWDCMLDDFDVDDGRTRSNEGNFLRIISIL